MFYPCNTFPELWLVRTTMFWRKKTICEEDLEILTFFFICFGLHLGGFPQDSNDSVVGAAHEDKRQDEDENLKVGKFENIFLRDEVVGGVFEIGNFEDAKYSQGWGGVFEGVALTYKLVDGHPDSPPGSAEVAESFKQYLASV